MAYILRDEYDGPWRALGTSPEAWFTELGPGLVVSQEEIIKNAVPYKCGEGPQDHVIYFLIQGDEIFYVGESSNPAQRLIQHWEKGWNIEKYYAITGLPRLYIVHYETFYIWRHKPKLNVKYPAIDSVLEKYL